VSLDLKPVFGLKHPVGNEIVRIPGSGSMGEVKKDLPGVNSPLPSRFNIFKPEYPGEVPPDDVPFVTVDPPFALLQVNRV